MKESLFFLATLAAAQSFEQKGFVEVNSMLYPQSARNDSGHAVAEGLLRYEGFYRPHPAFRIAAGVDARWDTHQQTAADFNWWERTTHRSAFDIRRLSATYAQGKFSVELGKQFIRWGKADLLNPTDRFAPRDYLNVLETDFLAVTAARVTYGMQSDTIDVVFEPRLTPSRIPLPRQRWLTVDSVPDLRPFLPGGPQAGARWNHIGRGVEYSLSFYNGYNHLPPYAQMRMYGGDAALPLRWLTIKGEAAYFASKTRYEDEYVLYVIQLERQAGEWFFVGGYAGEAVTNGRSIVDFAPDRGLAKAWLGRAGYTIDTNRSVALETAVRQNGHGLWTKLEYSQALGQHLRATAAIGLIRGRQDDFLGQYRRNSHAMVTLRYSF
jgi:hypothetical protein